MDHMIIVRLQKQLAASGKLLANRAVISQSFHRNISEMTALSYSRPLFCC